jgi:hypothetical protein
VKKLLSLLIYLSAFGVVIGQTNTSTSGSWADPTVWSTGTVPGTSATVNVNHPLTIDQDINIIAGGNYTINASSTDFTGGTPYILDMTGGSLTIGNGSNSVTVTFEGGASFENATLLIRTGSTLILGATYFDNGNTVTVEAGATLIVNGALLNSNSAGTITIGGLIYVNGDYDTNNGSLVVSGSGDLIVNGTITNQGSSTTFGSNNDCGSPPCSGQNLCTGQTNSITPASQFICSGGSISALNGNTMTGVTYQWQSSTTSATATDFADIGGATSEDFTPSVPSVTTWYRRAATLTADPTCVGRSVPVQITVTASGSWSGNVSTDWNDVGNWCGGVIPTAATDVVINSTAARQPTISNANAVCRNLTIASGATITITDRTLEITGNLAYNGTLTFNGTPTGTVSFTGSSAQTITGTTPYIFNNVIFANTSGATPSLTFSGNAITINRGLTMTSGSIDLGGFNVTLGTSATVPGTLTYTAGRFYNGNITRWFGTSAVAVENVAGFFPIGTSAYNRPFYLGLTGLSAGGTIRVQHTGVTGATAASFNDANPVVAIQAVSNSLWTLSSANGLTVGANTYSATTGGTGLGTVADAVNHLRLTQQGADMGGSAGVNDASTTDLRVRRTGFLFPSNPFSVRIATSNSTLSPLPIHLIAFSVRPTAEGAKLEWTTSMEENFDYFGIERSSDGIHFAEISQSRAMGSRNVTTDYSYLDGAVRKGRYYYRLRSVDLDQTFSYSAVMMVDLESSTREIASVYPNPVSSKMTVSLFDGKTGKLILFDRFGRAVREADLHEGIQDFEINDLTDGIYFAKIRSENGQQTIKLAVSH